MAFHNIWDLTRSFIKSSLSEDMKLSFLAWPWIYHQSQNSMEESPTKAADLRYILLGGIQPTFTAEAGADASGGLTAGVCYCVRMQGIEWRPDSHRGDGLCVNGSCGPSLQQGQPLGRECVALSSLFHGRECWAPAPSLSCRERVSLNGTFSLF